MKVEDHQSVWTIFPNVNLRFDRRKAVLIKHRYAKGQAITGKGCSSWTIVAMQYSLWVEFLL